MDYLDSEIATKSIYLRGIKKRNLISNLLVRIKLHLFAAIHAVLM